MSQIATIPAQAAASPRSTYPISHRTGQPLKPALAVVSAGFFWAAMVCCTASFAEFWRIAYKAGNFHSSARLVGWIEPEPSSWAMVFIVIGIAILHVVVVGLSGAAAFLTWRGDWRSPVVALIAVGASLLTFLLNQYAPLTIVFAAIGAALAWMPPLKPYRQAVAEANRRPDEVPLVIHRVRYGTRYFGQR